MMHPDSAAQRCRGREPNAGFFSLKFLSHGNPCELHRGKRNFAPSYFGRNGQPIKPGDRPIALGDSDPSRQPTELAGFFGPLVIVPVLGDWLVELRGFEPETLFGAIAKSKKFDGDRVSRRTHARSATVFLTSKQPS
jgi:hypothetical protein